MPGLKTRPTWCIPGQFAAEPCAGDGPVAFDGFWRDSQRVGHFVDGQAAEITELDDLGLTCGEPGQPFERLVEGRPPVTLRGIDQRHGFVERNAALVFPAAFFAVAAARVFDQHLAHQVRGDADESGAIVPVVASLRGEPQIDLVDKRRRLKGMACALLPQVVVRKTPKLRVHDRQEFVGVGHLSNYARAVLTLYSAQARGSAERGNLQRRTPKAM